MKSMFLPGILTLSVVGTALLPVAVVRAQEADGATTLQQVEGFSVDRNPSLLFMDPNTGSSDDLNQPWTGFDRESLDYLYPPVRLTRGSEARLEELGDGAKLLVPIEDLEDL